MGRRDDRTRWIKVASVEVLLSKIVKGYSVEEFKRCGSAWQDEIERIESNLYVGS
jgi:hypothetical protein